MKTLVILFLLIGTHCFGATYYIDYAGGSDSNNGKSTAAAWKRHPYMTGWSGSYSHSSGDKFIFKGGITWTSSCFPLTIVAGGSSSGNDSYTVDKSWYSGSSWSRPLFDGNYEKSDIVSLGANYITIEGIEMKRVTSSKNYGYGLISAGGPTNILIKDCYLHGWRTTASTDDAHGGVIMTWYDKAADTIVIDSTEIENSENSNAYNGVCVRAVGTIRNSKIHDNSSAVLFCLDFDGSELYNITGVGFDRNYHFNGIYLDPTTLGKSVGYIRNSVLRDVAGGANMAYPNVRGGASIYIYNNVMYGTQSAQLAIEIDPYQYGGEGPGSCYVYNNTIVNYATSAAAVHVVGRAGQPIKILKVINNHIIGTGAKATDGVQGSSVTTLTESNNIIQTPAVAAAQGYTLSNLYAPMLGGSTIDAGTIGLNGLDLILSLGSARDIGAYEYSSGSPASTLPPTNAAISIAVQ